MVRVWRRYLALSPDNDADLPKIRLLVDEAERALRRNGGGGGAATAR